jgi:luciferase-like monooxygenase
VSELVAELAGELPGVELRPSQFHGEPALWFDGREIVHAHGHKTVEIRLTRRLIAQLDEPRAPARARTSDWVIVAAEHADLVRRLARDALEANRARRRGYRASSPPP